MTTQQEAKPHGRMKRLPKVFYRGHAFVHWSMTIDGRRTGWLDEGLHFRFRELQLQTLVRYELLCLAYCLMPDHIHCLWAGLSEASDQDRGAASFRKYLNACLVSRGVSLQKQPWDDVLLQQERERGAVLKTAFYIAENPVRAGLVGQAAAWEYSGSQAAGYPDLDWRNKDFAPRIWKIYELEARRLRVV